MSFIRSSVNQEYTSYAIHTESLVAGFLASAAIDAFICLRKITNFYLTALRVFMTAIVCACHFHTGREFHFDRSICICVRGCSKHLSEHKSKS